MRSSTPSVIVKKQSVMIRLYLLPPFLKLLTATFLFFIICIIGFAYLKQKAAVEYSQVNMQRAIIEKTVSDNAMQFGQMNFLSKNAVAAKDQYVAILKQFPSESQIGDLLSSITKLGTSEGLKFVSFRPLSSVSHGYYADAPVEVVVVGRFHQLGRFLSGVANLPGSVVAVDQFSLKQANPQQPDDLLSLEFTATLYYTLPTSAELST